MKKLTLLTLILCLGFSSFAQLPISLGVKLGLNSSNIISEDYAKGTVWRTYHEDIYIEDAKNGMNIGAFARLKLKKLYIQPELYYSVKKGETKFDYEKDVLTQKMKLKTIDIPVLLGVKVVDFKVASVRAFTGPVMSLILDNSSISYNQKKEFIHEIDNLENDFTTDNWKFNSWGWQLGGGIDVAMFTFDVRYEWGLTNVTNFYSINDIGKIGLENKSRMLSFSIGYKFF